METYCDKISLIQTKPEVCTFEVTPGVPPKTLRNENPLRNINAGTIPKSVQTERSTAPQKVVITENDEAAEERQRTGRYLAIGVTLIMLFIAFYHTLLRHATVLAGLLAPAIIMLLYILWLFYFAKKKKTQDDFHAARLKNRTTLLYSEFERGESPSRQSARRKYYFEKVDMKVLQEMGVTISLTIITASWFKNN